jgi:hypothetical protein
VILQELEHQLVAAAEEKTKVQSKFHELSIKHRQLIETSPQVCPAQHAGGHGTRTAQQQCWQQEQ